MNLSLLLFGIGGLISPAYLIYTTRPQSIKKTVIKTAPLAFLTAASMTAGAPPFLTFALFLSGLGDLALSRDGRKAFLFGLCAFGLAHLCFIMLFQSIGGGHGYEAFAANPLFAVAITVAALSSEIWLAPFTGPLRWPVRGYVALIAYMGLTALTLPGGFSAVVWGAFLFMASDTCLSLALFRIAPNDPRQRIAAWTLWGLYIAAVALIFWGIVAI